MMTHKEQTSNQRNEIAEQFAELVVDGIDTKDLVRYVYADLMDSYCKCTVDELEEYVYNYDEELWEELVDNVTNETFIDINNTGGKY